MISHNVGYRVREIGTERTAWNWFIPPGSIWKLVLVLGLLFKKLNFIHNS